MVNCAQRLPLPSSYFRRDDDLNELLPNDLKEDLPDDTLGLPDDLKEDLSDDTLGMPDNLKEDLPDYTLGMPDDLKEGPVDTLSLPDDLKEGPGDILEPLDDLEEGFDDILELLDDLPGDATLGLACDLGDDLLEECFSELLALLFFWPPAQDAQPSPSRLFSTGRYLIFFVRHCIYSPTFDFCLCSGTYFILRSVSL